MRLNQRACNAELGRPWPFLAYQIRIGNVARSEDGLYDPEDVRRQLQEKGVQIERTPRPEQVQGIPDYNISRAKKEAARAQKELIEVMELQGKMINTEEYASLWFEKTRTARDALLSIPDRLSSVCAMRPAAEIHAIIKTEVERICDALGGPPEK